MLTRWTRLGIQRKIFASLAMILALMAATIVVGVVSEREEARLSDTLINHLLPARAAVRGIKRTVVAADDAGASYVLATRSPQRSRFLAQYNTNVSTISRWVDGARASASGATERNALAVFASYWRYYDNANREAFALVQRGKLQNARQYVDAPYQPLIAALDRYERVAIDLPAANAEARRRTVRFSAAASAAVLGAGALGIAIAIALRLGGSLRRRLGSVSNAISDVVHTDLPELDASFRNIAEGNLEATRYTCTRDPLADSDGDELGVLARSYNDLIGGLRELSQRMDDSVLSARRRREAEERLSYLQQYDEVTGMANRHLLVAELNREIRTAGRSSGVIAVAYFGLIGLNKIEDSFGRPFVDRMLKTLGRRLENALRENDCVARAGYDQFVAFFLHLSGAPDAIEYARTLLTRLGQPFLLDGRQVVVNACAGVSSYPRDGHDADELVRNASTAMWYARESGSGEIALYSPQLRTESLTRITIESDLRRALREREFELHYQPIVNVGTRRIDAFEALLRWNHPRLGLLEPASFIDVAEDCGSIETLGRWVLENACAQAQEWREGGHDVGVSVNVSMRQFRGDLVKMVQRALSSTHFPPHGLELELTESVFLSDRGGAGRALSSLKRLGVRVAIDDFGTGYSSFAYLRSFPLDALKIDRSFVSDITSRSFDEAIARAIILLGRSLGIRVIAEGVEDARQAAALHRLGCRVMQGYFFGKPAPARECLELLETTVPVSK